MQILGVSTVFPKDKLPTRRLVDAFPCQLPESVKQNILNLGVSSRYLIDPNIPQSANGEGLVDLCREACEKTIEQADLPVKNVNYLVASYDANPILSPGLSQLLIRKLGLSSHTRHVNVQGAASTAFLKTLETAQYYLGSHQKGNVLLCVSGVNSYWFHNQVKGIEDVKGIGEIKAIRNKAVREIELRKWVATMQFFLFGDGVAAVLVSNEGVGLSVGKIVEVTNIGKKDYLAGYARLSVQNEPFKFGFHSHLGKEIPALGIKYSTAALRRLLGKNIGDTLKTVRKCAVHTGSEKILNLIAERHNIAPEKIKESHEVLKEYGNLAGASLPFVLRRILADTKLTSGDSILTLGYGWGFSASACMLEYVR